MKITFINPKISQNYKGPRAKIYPHLGILSLATYLKNNLGEKVDITAIDEIIEDKISEDVYKCDVMCVSVNSFNYENGLKHAKKAKENGAAVILGGPHATVFPENILRIRPEVDFVITHEGEVSLLGLVSNIMDRRSDYAKIPNLFYRENGVIRSSQLHYENDLKKLPIIDRSYLPIEQYINNYQNVYRDALDKIDYMRPTAIYSSKGCTWRDRSGGCVFCARLEKNVRFREIEDIWKEIRTLTEQYRIDHIWDISDDNLSDIKWYKDFVDQKPPDINPKFLIYSRAFAIKEELSVYLKKLNVHEIYVGFESGDQEMLRAAKKGSSLTQNIRAIEAISKFGVYIYPSFVLGLPDESESSLKNTLSFINKITQKCNFYRISATILIPIPGSEAFRLLAQHEELKDRDYMNKDNFDLRAMEREWVRLFTKVDYETLEKYRDEINNMSLKGVWD